tara:strand:+ start:374 stop:574 length:201 start_codon:yes stop_codon:yes gene_type:complete
MQPSGRNAKFFGPGPENLQQTLHTVLPNNRIEFGSLGHGHGDAFNHYIDNAVLPILGPHTPFCLDL